LQQAKNWHIISLHQKNSISLIPFNPKNMKTLSNTEISKQLKGAAANGSDGCLWLARAYLSWYRGSCMIALDRFENLDRCNQILFIQMLTLRQRPNWNDQFLYELEQDIIRLMNT
jgi:hypothetical protein